MPKMMCPLPGCGEVFEKEEDIIEHFNKEHPKFKKIRIGDKKINLERK